MQNFKFLRETVDNPDMLNEGTYATASFNDDTPEGHMNRRSLYHTNRGQYDRLRHPNNEMEQYFYDRDLRPDTLTAERISELTRRINGGERTTFFTRVEKSTKVNPKWWMKIKMFFQEANFNGEIVGIIFIAGSFTFGVILVISKLLNAW